MGIEPREEIFLRPRPPKEYNEGKIGVSKGIYCNIGIRNNIFFYLGKEIIRKHVKLFNAL
ncbi:MAG: hypothetical protein ACFFAN_18560 [Promethearchaeota archaeon]